MKRAALALLLAVPQVHAATVEVRVQDGDDVALPRQTVSIDAVSPSMEPLRVFIYPNTVRTGDSGTATFQGLKPGLYRISLAASPEFVTPGSDADAVQVVTLRSEDDRASVVLTLRRGVRIVTRMTAEQRGAGQGRLVLEGERTGGRMELRAIEGVYSDVMVKPDRWHVRFTPPEAWTTIASELNGQHWRDEAVELQPDAPTTFLEWRISAPGTVEGRITSAGVGIPFGVVLDLVSLGPWGAAQEALGWQVPRQVHAGSDDRGRMRVRLPDGTWRARPMLEAIPGATSQPEFVLTDVPAGGSGRADFDLTFPDSEGPLARGRPNVAVYVSAPDGRPLKAEVTIYRAGTREQVAHADPDVEKRFTLEAGSYTVVGSHPDYLESSTDLLNFQPGPKIEGVDVRLRAGATIRVQAKDGKGAPVASVHVRVAGEDDKERKRDTDASGWVTFPGLPAGRYTLEAAVDRSKQARIVWEGDTVLTATEGESLDRQLKVLPAATLTAVLACVEGEALPATVSARIVTAEIDVSDGEVVKAALKKPVMAADFPLEAGGKVAVGPLEEGAVRLWLLPADYDRGTWAPGTEEAVESDRVQIEGAGPVDLGTIQVHCGPRAALRLDSKAPAIDLRLGTAQVKGVLLDGFDPVTEKTERRLPLRPLSLRRTREALEASGLPEGTVELTFTLCSPSAPKPAQGNAGCAPAEGVVATPAHWTVRVPAVLGKISETRVEWPWP